MNKQFAQTASSKMSAAFLKVAQGVKVSKDSMQTAAVAVAGTVAGMTLTPVLAPVILHSVGFGAVGPVLGSWAAGIQAGIGSVSAGSSFAVAQSVAMGGATPVGWIVIGGLVAGVTAVCAFVLIRKLMRRRAARKAKEMEVAARKDSEKY